MRAFLLGQLGEQDAAAIEEAAFEDPASFEELQTVEDELYEAYLDDALAPLDKTAFEQRFLTTAEGRTKLARLRSLVRLAEAERRPETAPEALAAPRPPRPADGGSWLARLQAWIGALSPPVRAFAMLAIAVVIGTGLLFGRGGPEPMFLALQGEALRAGSAAPELVLVPGARRVRIELGLDALPPLERAELELRRGGTSLWKGPPSSANQWALMIEIDAALLKPGSYTLVLTDGAAPSEVLAEPRFDVVNPRR